MDAVCNRLVAIKSHWKRLVFYVFKMKCSVVASIWTDFVDVTC